jgi:hypothetical protein
MRPGVCISAAFLTGLLACERTEVHNPISGTPLDASVAVGADLRPDSGTGPAPPAAMAVRPFPVPAPPPPSTPGPGLRVRFGPLLRFRLVPVGAAAVEPARAATPALRERYAAFAFELGATLASLPSNAADCASFLSTVVGARGTLFVVATPLRCASPFGALDPRISAAVVLLPPLGTAGNPEAARRLPALLASDVGELLGLSYPCADGRTCCLLRTAPDLRVFDARAGVSSCPQHGGELDRIRTDAGLQ